MNFYTVLRHLLPDSFVWRPRDIAAIDWVIGDDVEIGDDLTIGPAATSDGLALWRFLKALTSSADAAEYFIDKVFEDAFPSKTRELDEWEKQFGLPSSGSDGERASQVAAAWAATGGQSPRYLQDVIQTAGFPLYVHEWWASGPPYVSRDPRSYVHAPRIGDVQCEAWGRPSVPRCSAAANGPQCSRFVVNEPGYIVNGDLTRRAPPRVPDDPLTWRSFLYLGGETFPNRVAIPANRRSALERLVLQHRPSQHWVVMLVDYV